MKFKLNLEILLLILIVFLGFLARLYKIDNPVADWHSWRQADTASVTRFYVRDGINLLYPRYQDISFLQTGRDNPQGWRFVEFPIYNAVHAVLVENFTQFSLEKWGRLLSVFSSLVSVVLIYLLGKRFLGAAGGLLASFFFALLPFNIYFSRVILPEPMSVMFGLAALVAFPSHLILSGILFALGILVKPHVGFYGIAMLWLALRKFGWALHRNRGLWVFAAIALLPFIGWRAWLEQHPEGIPHIKWMFNSDGLRWKPAFWRWLFGERIGRLILGEWGILLFAVGLIAKARGKLENYFPQALFAASFVYMSTLASANVRHDYYQTFIIPAVSLVLAKGVLELWNTRYFNLLFARFVTVGAVFFMLGFSWYQIREFYKINHPEILEAGSAVQRLVPEDALIVAPYNGDTALLYQTNRSGWPYLTYAIEQLISMGATHYVSVNPQAPEAQDVYRKFIILEEKENYFVAKLEPKPHTD